MLAILSVKQARLNLSVVPLISFADDLCNQMGGAFSDTYIRVILSPEYEALYQANLALFDGVEKVRHGEGMSAKEFDDLNQARHRAKQALQKRFWNNELTEVKT